MKHIKEKYSGERYSFQLEITLDKTSIFQIHAKYLKNNTYSTITNINWIISEFGQILVNQTEMCDINWETDWYIKNHNIAQKLWQKATITFSDKSFIRYLEGQLDDDRKFGKWQSGYIF